MDAMSYLIVLTMLPIASALSGRVIDLGLPLKEHGSMLKGVVAVIVFTGLAIGTGWLINLGITNDVIQ